MHLCLRLSPNLIALQASSVRLLECKPNGFICVTLFAFLTCLSLGAAQENEINFIFAWMIPPSQPATPSQLPSTPPTPLVLSSVRPGDNGPSLSYTRATLTSSPNRTPRLFFPMYSTIPLCLLEPTPSSGPNRPTNGNLNQETRDDWPSNGLSEAVGSLCRSIGSPSFILPSRETTSTSPAQRSR